MNDEFVEWSEWSEKILAGAPAIVLHEIQINTESRLNAVRAMDLFPKHIK